MLHGKNFLHIRSQIIKMSILLLRETEGLTDEDILYLCECAKYLKAKNRQIRKRK